MQPVGRPVRRHIGAMAPDRADFLPAHGLPDILAILDLLAGEHHLAVGGDHALGHRRGQAINFPAIIAQDEEGEGDDAEQAQPEFAIGSRLGVHGVIVNQRSQCSAARSPTFDLGQGLRALRSQRRGSHSDALPQGEGTGFACAATNPDLGACSVSTPDRTSTPLIRIPQLGCRRSAERRYARLSVAAFGRKPPSPDLPPAPALPEGLPLLGERVRGRLLFRGGPLLRLGDVGLAQGLAQMG